MDERNCVGFRGWRGCEDDPFCGWGDWPPPPPSDLPEPPPPPVTVEEPVPRGSFPGGETLGLPPGMRLPGPLSAQVLLGLWDLNCNGGVCVPGFGLESLESRAALGKGTCFVKGLTNGAVGAVVVAGATAVAAAVLAPEVVTGALLVGAGYGLVQTGSSVYSNLQSGNRAGLAYNAGSVIGGLLGGGATSFGVRYSITGETNLPTSIGDFFGKRKGIDFSRPGQSPFAAIRAAFSKGPDLGGGAVALGLAGAGTASGCN